MSKLLAVLIAGVFATVSINGFAQEKKADAPAAEVKKDEKKAEKPAKKEKKAKKAKKAKAEKKAEEAPKK